jgi:outer membrane protein assembly factor BamB
VCITNFDFGNYTYGQGYVQFFDLVSSAVVRSIPVGTNPQDIALGYDDYLYVICTGNYATQSGILYKLASTTGSIIDSLRIGGTPASLAITHSGIMFLAAGGFVGHGEVYTVDLNAFAVLRGPGNPISTGLGVTAVIAVSDSTVVSCNFSDDTITEITPSGRILATFRTGDGPVAAAKYPACYAIKGDADGSGEINISDAVFLVNYIFRNGPAHVSIEAGDMNCDMEVDIADAVSIIFFIFSSGHGSCGCAD